MDKLEQLENEIFIINQYLLSKDREFATFRNEALFWKELFKKENENE